MLSRHIPTRNGSERAVASSPSDGLCVGQVSRSRLLSEGRRKSRLGAYGAECRGQGDLPFTLGAQAAGSYLGFYRALDARCS